MLKLNKFTLLVYSALYASVSHAGESKNSLSEIVVYAEQTSSLSSSQVMTSDKIKTQPVSNANMVDYLKPNPHIRFVDSNENNFERGEIKPQAISINGSDPEQTAYFIDNVNINNDLALDNELFDGSVGVVPGINHRQAYFFDANLLSSVVVHDSNISASLGGFSGGAVVAKTKQYNEQDGVKLYYRTTHSSWAELNADAGAQAILQRVRPEGTDAILQPKYAKHHWGIMIEQGITDNLGVVIGGSQRRSNIVQYRLVGAEGQTDKQNHTRRSDNALVNFNWQINEQHRLEWGLRYSNYREGKYYAENLDNNILDEHQAYGSTLAWINSMDLGVLTTTLAYDNFTDKRKSNSAFAEQVAVYEDGFTFAGVTYPGDLLYNYEKGGYGNSKLNQQNWNFSSEFAIEPFRLGAFEQAISIGGGVPTHFI